MITALSNHSAMKSHALNELKAALGLKTTLRNLVNEDIQEQRKLDAGLKNVPVGSILDQIKYLEEVMLPKIAEKQGANSENYKFYSGVGDSLSWAVLILERYEALQVRYSRDKLFYDFQTERLELAEKELAKYELAEDIILSDAWDKYLTAAAQRIRDKFDKKQ